MHVHMHMYKYIYIYVYIYRYIEKVTISDVEHVLPSGKLLPELAFSWELHSVEGDATNTLVKDKKLHVMEIVG